jgi:hypothetical protein
LNESGHKPAVRALGKEEAALPHVDSLNQRCIKGKNKYLAYLAFHAQRAGTLGVIHFVVRPVSVDLFFKVN